MEFLAWIENTALSGWFREAIWAFPTLLVLHALGMAFLVGTSITMNLRLLGFMPNLSLHGFLRFYPVLIVGFIINLVSGVALLLAYPAKGLTNPLFYIKLGLIFAALVITWRQKSVFNNSGLITQSIRVGAIAILLLWLGGIVSGRFLAYTHTWLLVS